MKLNNAVKLGQRMKLWFPTRFVTLRAFALGLALCSTLPVSAYYPFLHLRSVEGQWVAVPERFDLRAQPDGAVPVVVSRGAELQLNDGEVWESVVSEVHLALEQWSTSSLSSLRLRYAGETAPDRPTDAPHVQVLFDELAPGVVAMGGPVETTDVIEDANGSFRPIRKSLVLLSNNLRERPSYTEAFFLTLVHELGHAIGLQHTFTSSVMSTGVTRSTTKAKPLATDDHAGIASLYPAQYVDQELGTLRGYVRMGDAGVHFATVTAVAPTGEAISTLTLPDGRFEIRGVPAGNYYLYAQAPPVSSDPSLGPGQIVLPKNEDGASIQPGPSFATRFYPDVAAWPEAPMVQVIAGAVLDTLDITVPYRGDNGFRGATTYAFPGNFAVNPAFVNRNGNRHFLVAQGNGLTANGEKTGGLELSLIGADFDQANALAYPWATSFLQVNVAPDTFEFDGAKTIVWKNGDDIYVQPSAFHVVSLAPPKVESVASLAANEQHGERLQLTGQGLDRQTRFSVEGLDLNLQVETVSQTAEDQTENHFDNYFVPTPYTNDGRSVRLVAFHPNGQSSLHLDAEALLAPSRVAATGNVQWNAKEIEAGSNALIFLQSDAPVFAGKRIWLNFGDPGLVCTHIWKLDDQHIAANISASPTVAWGSYTLQIHNDLALMPVGEMLQVVPSAGLPQIAPTSLHDAVTGDRVLYPGAVARFQIVGETSEESLNIRIGDESVTAKRVDADSRTYEFQVPAGASPGLTALKAETAGISPYAIGIELGPQPPRIVEASADGRSSRLESSSRGRLTIRTLLALVPMPDDPEADAPDISALLANAKTPRVLLNGRLCQDVLFQESADRKGLVEIQADIPSTAVSTEDGTANLQIEWQGRLSTPYRLWVTRPSTATLR